MARPTRRKTERIQTQQQVFTGAPGQQVRQDHAGLSGLARNPQSKAVADFVAQARWVEREGQGGFALSTDIMNFVANHASDDPDGCRTLIGELAALLKWDDFQLRERWAVTISHFLKHIAADAAECRTLIDQVATVCNDHPDDWILRRHWDAQAAWFRQKHPVAAGEATPAVHGEARLIEAPLFEPGVGFVGDIGQTAEDDDGATNTAGYSGNSPPPEAAVTPQLRMRDETTSFTYEAAEREVARRRGFASVEEMDAALRLAAANSTLGRQLKKFREAFASVAVPSEGFDLAGARAAGKVVTTYQRIRSNPATATVAPDLLTEKVAEQVNEIERARAAFYRAGKHREAAA